MFRPPIFPLKPRARHASRTDKDGPEMRQEEVIEISHHGRDKPKGRAIHDTVNSRRVMDSNLQSRVNRNNRQLDKNTYLRPHVINPCPSQPCFRQSQYHDEAAERPLARLLIIWFWSIENLISKAALRLSIR